MHFITPRKAAVGLGASGTGTANHWALTVSSVALAILTPLFLWVVGQAIGYDQIGVVAHFGSPLPALITALFVVIGMAHYIRGTRIMIDDYVRGPARTWALIASQLFGWVVIAVTLVSLARMALIGITV